MSDSICNLCNWKERMDWLKNRKCFFRRVLLENNRCWQAHEYSREKVQYRIAFPTQKQNWRVCFSVLLHAEEEGVTLLPSSLSLDKSTRILTIIHFLLTSKTYAMIHSLCPCLATSCSLQPATLTTVYRWMLAPIEHWNINFVNGSNK